MGFGVLRVINDDIFEPSGGFGKHPHRDMEIITIVIKGSLEHKDSEGNHGIITTGQIQYMSAGSGVHHSEFNPSADETVELFQIWIHPRSKGLSPSYEQRDFRDLDTKNRWALIISGDGANGSMPIRQDASILMSRLEAGYTLICEPIKAGHGRLLFIIEGVVQCCGDILMPRDELQVLSDESFELMASTDAYLLLFDVPMRS
jgi:redox-sensitive bicupin YhaK (pirin superfamily)